jgi:taurine dioxygenase
MLPRPLRRFRPSGSASLKKSPWCIIARISALFVTNGSTKRIEGLGDEKGRILLKELIGHCTQEQFVYRHKWRDGDVLIWNDVGTLHTATAYDESKYERLVYRTWMRPFDVVPKTTALEEQLQHH